VLLRGRKVVSQNIKPSPTPILAEYDENKIVSIDFAYTSASAM
jgi:hypothetical protein